MHRPPLAGPREVLEKLAATLAAHEEGPFDQAAAAASPLCRSPKPYQFI